MVGGVGILVANSGLCSDWLEFMPASVQVGQFLLVSILFAISTMLVIKLFEYHLLNIGIVAFLCLHFLVFLPEATKPFGVGVGEATYCGDWHLKMDRRKLRK